MEKRDPRQTAAQAHTHDGPRTGQTDTDDYVMTCETCGVQYVSGLEEMDREGVVAVMELLYGEE